MAQKLRVGVVGTGFGVQHVRAFGAHPRGEVVALCSSDAARAARAADALGVPRAYGDYEAMIADAPIDAVAVAAPPDLHLPVCAAAFAAGKHVICEKPLAGTLDDAHEMLRLARGSGLVHGVEQWLRALPGSLYARELIEQGAIGRPLSIADSIVMDVWGYYGNAGANTNYGGSPNKNGWFTRRDGRGGFLLATAQHLYDRLLWLFGPVRSVEGRVHTAVPRPRLADGAVLEVDAPDSAHAVFAFASGAVALCQLTPGAWGTHPMRMEVQGDEGALLLAGGPTSPTLRLARRGTGAYQEAAIPDRLLDRRVPAGLNPGLFAMVDRFTRAVLDGEPMSPTFEDGCRTQELLDALDRSAATGQRQELGTEAASVGAGRGVGPS